MNPIPFEECTSIYAEDQPEYLPLPGLKKLNGEVVTCWNLTLRERIRILFSGKMWLNIHTFNTPLQPLLPSVYKRDVI